MSSERHLNLLPARTTAAGLPRCRSHPNPGAFSGDRSNEPFIEEVQVEWEPILEDIVMRYGGSEPVYRTENVGEGRYMSHVTFSIAVDTGSATNKQFHCTSLENCTPQKAQSEAAAKALQNMSWGTLGSAVVDISQMRISEMENNCRRPLLKVKRFIRLCKADIENWSEAISRVEACYSLLKNFFAGADWISRQAMSDGADPLITMKDKHEAQLKILCAQMKECKIEGEDLYNAVTDHLHPQLVPKPHSRRHLVQNEIKISAHIMLRQMIKSLGWGHAALEQFDASTNLYATIRELSTSRYGLDAVEEEESVVVSDREKTAEQAIFYLEKELSIYVVDLNYNKRTSLEKYVLEAEDIAGRATTVSKAVRTAWENLVKELKDLNAMNTQKVKEHKIQGPNDVLYTVKCACTEAVAHLHRDCQFDWQAGSLARSSAH